MDKEFIEWAENCREDVDGFYIPFVVGTYSEETIKSYKFDIFKQ